MRNMGFENALVDDQAFSVASTQHGYAEYGETMAPISNVKYGSVVH